MASNNYSQEFAELDKNLELFVEEVKKQNSPSAIDFIVRHLATHTLQVKRAK
jgi:hypothetical protein